MRQCQFYNTKTVKVKYIGMFRFIEGINIGFQGIDTRLMSILYSAF